MKQSAFLFLLALAFPLAAQSVLPPDTSAYSSIEGMLSELHRHISSSPGGVKNLDAVRALCLPTARFTVLMHAPDEPAAYESVDLDAFLEYLADPYYEDRFEETSLHHIVEQYNGIAQVFQTFRARDRDGLDERGLNSYQLLFADGRWWIVSVLWTGEDAGEAIPEKYLPSGKGVNR